MSQFSIMLVPASGQVRRLKIGQYSVLAAGLLMFSMLSFGSWGAYKVYHAEELKSALNEAQQLLEMTRSRHEKDVAHWQDMLATEQVKLAAYAKSIGQLQARMSRLDSLGERLVEVSSLDASEFDFGLKPAVGGPRVESNSLTGELGLNDTVQHLETRLDSLDSQLATIDYMLQSERDEAAARPHAWPSTGGWVSSHYGRRIDPINGGVAIHRGLDIANRLGAPVLAASRGVVVFAGKKRDYGYVVEVEHGYGFKTRYAHLSSIVVKVGDALKDSQLLGRIGSTGRSTGPHLHYEVHKNGQLIDPMSFIPRG